LIALPYLADCGWKQKLETIKRHNIERLQPIPYFTKYLPSHNEGTVASVLGVYGRGKDNDEYMHRVQVENATFQPLQGIKGHSFWHMYGEGALEMKTIERSQRAVLLQTVQNYRKIMQANFECFPETEMDVVLDPCFGEQLIIDCPDDICLGDVWAVTGSTARFRVTSPRKPCNEIDNRNGAMYGPRGLRLFTLPRGLAGIFCLVEAEGKVEKGSKFELVERPYPQWSMVELSKAIYGGEGDPKAIMRGVGSWGRPVKELHKLIQNPYLAECEWKDELRKIAKKLEKKGGRSRKNSVSLMSLRRLELKSTWIPFIIAFFFAMLSCLMVMVMTD